MFKLIKKNFSRPAYPELLNWRNGVMEYWSIGIINENHHSFEIIPLLHYSSQMYLKFFLTMLDTGFLILDFLYGIENQVSSIQNLRDKFSDFSKEESTTPLFHSSYFHTSLKLRNIILALIILWLTPSIVFAQYGSSGLTDARSIAMGNTYNADARGVYSIGLNPSGLGFLKEYSVEFSTVLPMPGASVSTGTDFLSLNDFNYFFGGVNGRPRYLDDNDKERLNSIFENGGSAFVNSSFNLLTICYKPSSHVGTFAFSINDAAAGWLRFPNALSSLILYGNQTGKVYNLSGVSVNSWWIRDYSLSYAREFPGIGDDAADKLYAGITLKLVHGLAYSVSQEGYGYLSTGANNQLTAVSNNKITTAFSDNLGVKYSFDTTSRSASFSLFPSPAGTGFGADLGLNAAFGKEWNVSLAVTDLGSITWDKNTAVISSNGQYTVTDLTDSNQLDSLKNKFTGQTDSTGSFITSLPTAFRLGVSYRAGLDDGDFPGSLLLALDVNQGFNNQPGNSVKTRISFGAEWKPMNWIPYFRTGFSFGGLTGFHWAFGIGIDASIVNINFGTMDMQSVFAPGSSKQFSIAFDSYWKL